MDRERLTELLQEPAHVAKEDLGDLRSLTGRFPWFSGAHLLLAVGEHAQGDVLSNDPALNPAAYLPSRSVLFDLVQAETPMRPTMRVVKDKPQIGEGLPPMAEETRPILPDSTEGMEASAPPDAPGAEQLRPIPAPAPDVPSAVNEVSLDPVVEFQPAVAHNASANPGSFAAPHAASSMQPDPLESQIREAIMASGYDLTHIPSTPAPPPAPAPLAPAPVPLPSSLATTEDPGGQPVRPAVRITTESRLRFTDWLAASNEASPVPPTFAPPRARTEATSSAPAPDIITPPAGEALPDPKEIVERFIQQATPAAPPVKTAFFTPQEAAKRSLVDDGLVSETLAKIYEQQGDMAKAKATYARLAIIHPEKSVYFAALSKALEGRSNK